MNLRMLFLIAAVVLIVLAVIATAATDAEALGVTWTSWLCGSLLAYFAAKVVEEWPVSKL